MVVTKERIWPPNPSWIEALETKKVTFKCTSVGKRGNNKKIVERIVKNSKKLKLSTDFFPIITIYEQFRLNS